MRTLALAALLTLTACAGALPFLAAAAAVTSEAVKWIDAANAHVQPRLDADHARAVETAIARARAAAAALEHAARGAQSAHDRDYLAAADELQQALDALFVVTAPYGVRPHQPGAPGLLGASGGDVLTVPSACEIVRGEEACPSAAPAAPEPSAAIDGDHCIVPADALDECPADCFGCLVAAPRAHAVQAAAGMQPAHDGFGCGTLTSEQPVNPLVDPECFSGDSQLITSDPVWRGRNPGWSSACVVPR